MYIKYIKYNIYIYNSIYTIYIITYDYIYIVTGSTESSGKLQDNVSYY